MRIKITLLALFIPAALMGDDPLPTEITTVLGKKYEGVKVLGVDPDGLRIMHSGGAAKISFPDLPKNLQERFGFDPEMARQFAEQRAMGEAARIRQLEDAKARAKLEREAQMQADLKREASTFRPISASDVRAAWQRSLAVPPASLDSNYHEKVKRNNEIIALISSGKMDDQAKLTALEYNSNKLRALGRIEEANAYQSQSVELEKAIAKRQEAAALKANADALNNAIDFLRTW